MKLFKIIRVGTGKHEPDRSRSKKFRARPRSARGHWEIVTGKKPAVVKVKGKRFVGAV